MEIAGGRLGVRVKLAAGQEWIQERKRACAYYGGRIVEMPSSIVVVRRRGEKAIFTLNFVLVYYDELGNSTLPIVVPCPSSDDRHFLHWLFLLLFVVVVD